MNHHRQFLRPFDIDSSVNDDSTTRPETGINSGALPARTFQKLMLSPHSLLQHLHMSSASVDKSVRLASIHLQTTTLPPIWCAIALDTPKLMLSPLYASPTAITGCSNDLLPSYSASFQSTKCFILTSLFTIMVISLVRNFHFIRDSTDARLHAVLFGSYFEFQRHYTIANVTGLLSLVSRPVREPRPIIKPRSLTRIHASILLNNEELFKLCDFHSTDGHTTQHTMVSLGLVCKITGWAHISVTLFLSITDFSVIYRVAFGPGYGLRDVEDIVFLYQR